MSTISSFFQHNNYPSIPTLKKLCNGLNISLSDFFMEEPSPTYISEETRVLINSYNTMTPEQKNHLNSYIKGLIGKM
jgi:transcriptional regulator with XRE-family HTH domain